MPDKCSDSDIWHRLHEALEQGDEVQGIEEVKAEAIRALFKDPDLAKKADPRGIRLVGPMRVIGELNLDGVETKIGLTLTKCFFNGAVTLRDASVTWVRLDHCKLSSFAAERAKIDALELTDCEITGQCREGIVRLTGAHVAKELKLSGTRLVNQLGPALMVAGLTVDGSAFLERVCARGEWAPEGAICLSRATIGGDLVMRNAWVFASCGPALLAEGLTVKGNVFMCERRDQGAVFERRDDGAKAGESASSEAVRLAGANISEQLSLIGARLTNDAGPALAADFITVGQGMFLEDGFVAHGRSERGVVCIPCAKISGVLSLRGAELRNEGSGSALLAFGVSVQGDVQLKRHGEAGDAFRARGGGKDGTICLTDASLTKGFFFDGEVLNATESRPVLNLARTSVATLSLGRDSISCHRKMELDGLTYSGQPKLTPESSDARPRRSWRRLWRQDKRSSDVQRWISWFEQATPRYAAQPYEQLAATFVAAGDDADARLIYVAQRDDLRKRGKLGPLNQVGQFLLKYLIGYGYYSIRALWWLVGLFLVTAAIASAANGLVVKAPSTTELAASTVSETTKPTTAAQPVKPATPERCPVTARVGYALELSFPLINLNSAASGEQCTAATGAEGWVIGGWFVRAAAAVLAALYAAGLTGITRTS